MDFFNTYGLAVIVIMMIPNAIYFAQHKESFDNGWKNKPVAILEQIGRFGCFGFMVVDVPGWHFGGSAHVSLPLYLAGNALLVVAYLLFWVVSFNKMKRVFSALALSVTPSVIFIFSGVMSRSLPLLVAALVFAPCHILISVKNLQQN